jgi:hypothetical protein
VSNSQNGVISQRTKVLIDKLLLGKFSVIEIARIIGVSESWLQSYVNPNQVIETNKTEIYSRQLQ